MFFFQNKRGIFMFMHVLSSILILILMISKETLFVPMVNTTHSVEQSGTFLNFFGDSTVVFNYGRN